MAYHCALLLAFSEGAKDKISVKNRQILLEFVDKIALFAAAHKKENPLEFYSFLVYLLLILSKLDEFGKQFEQLPQQLALTL